MVRSPASASRKRRIDSSSEELEDVSMRSPRKSSKLRKVSLASPESSSNDGARELLDDGEGEEEEQPALETDGSGSSSSNASQEVGDEEDDAEYQEKLQIWEMFADEYHDSESFASLHLRFDLPACTLSIRKVKLTLVELKQSSENYLENFNAVSNSCLNMMSKCEVSLFYTFFPLACSCHCQPPSVSQSTRFRQQKTAGRITIIQACHLSILTCSYIYQ